MRGLELHRPPAVVFDAEKGTPTYGVFSAQPFERGWGLTIGTAMRRILLSSIEGCAITAVRFSGVDHEYDSIPGVMEDVTDIILNLKRVPLRLHGPEAISASVRMSEAGILTSAGIAAGPELDVVDKEVYLATVSEEGVVEAELEIARGRGYVPADDQQTRNLGLGFIYLDAAFSPVRRANYRIEPARVGQATDYEKLVLEVWTNGAVTPSEAVGEAARLLADHLPIFMAIEAPTAMSSPAAVDSVLDQDLASLPFGVRITNMLRSAGINTVGDLVSRTEKELKGISGFGDKAAAEVKEHLDAAGLSLGMRLDLPRE